MVQQLYEESAAGEAAFGASADVPEDDQRFNALSTLSKWKSRRHM